MKKIVRELTDLQNLTLELAQENLEPINADDVVEYAEKNEVIISKKQASKVLASLSNIGLLIRQPRKSRGWKLGWYPSYYKIAKHAGVHSCAKLYIMT
jgi:hypothetical protein